MTEYRVLVNGNQVQHGIRRLNQDQALATARAWKVADNTVTIQQRRLNDDGTVPATVLWRPFGS